MNTNTQIHLFGEVTIRSTQKGGKVMFCAIDVCRALEINNSRQAVSKLLDSEKDDVTLNDAIGRAQETTFVTEPGLYRLIFRSRKESARRFQDWVYHEVLPSIRRHGSYNPSHQGALHFIDALLERGADIKDAIRLATHTTPRARVSDFAGPKPLPKDREDAIATHILPRMEKDKKHTLSEVTAFLPPSHELMSGSIPACRSRLGKLLASYPGIDCHTTGRHPRYSLSKDRDKIIPLP